MTLKQKMLTRWMILSALMYSGSALAQSDLKSLLLEGFQREPQILEAQANSQAAHNQTEQAVSAHYPVFSVSGRQSLQRSKELDGERKFVPAATVTMNIYAFGQINKRIDYYKTNEQAYAYKYDETKENVAYRITELYLMAIRSQENITALNASLGRIGKILDMMASVAHIDRGRKSEYVQAQSRLYAIQQQMDAAQRDLEDNLSQLQRYTQRPVKEIQLIDPFAYLQAEAFAQRYAGDLKQNPSYLASQAEVKTAMADIAATKASRYPKIDLVGQATRDDHEVYLNMSWDVFNRGTNYGVREKGSLLTAQQRKLDQVVLDLEERTRSSLIDMKQYSKQAQALEKQVKAQQQVVEFYKMQFSIARRTLLDVLNAENELLSAEMSRVNAEYQARHAALDYLYSQGKTTQWAMDLE